MYNIHVLPASFGDSILIEFGKRASPKYILIDGGPYFNFPTVYRKMKDVAPNMTEIELLIVTHIDIDHIDGAITLLNREEQLFKVKEVWFNGYEQLTSLEKSDLLGALQGEYLTTVIAQTKIPHNEKFGGKAVYVADGNRLPVIDVSGFEITLLAPNKKALERLARSWKREIESIGGKEAVDKRWGSETRYTRDDLLGDDEADLSIEEMMESDLEGDKSVANQSSIAFIGTYDGKSCLFAGDSPTDHLLRGIEAMSPRERLRIDAWKLAHHGSKSSTLDSIMKKIECRHMIISSDGTRFQHPHPTCLAKLLKNNGPGLNFHFNYHSEANERWKDKATMEQYRYVNHFPENGNKGITLTLA